MKHILQVGPKGKIRYSMPEYVYSIFMRIWFVTQSLGHQKPTIQEVMNRLPADIRSKIRVKKLPLTGKEKTPAMIWLNEKLMGHKELLDTVWSPGKGHQEREIKKWRWN